MLTGGLIHLVHQLAVVATLLPEAETPIAILITGVLRKQPAALAALHADLERWLAVLRHRHPVFAGIRLAAAPDGIVINDGTIQTAAVDTTEEPEGE